jgi:heme/copper-type cytochrome/quinol oxidase subunit 3
VRMESPGPVHGPASSPRTTLVSSAALAMLIFAFAEVMLFSGLISAFTIIRSSALVWPPAGQPRLPYEETAANTTALLASGLFLALAHRTFRRDPARARWPLTLAIVLGGLFVVFQGTEWVALLRQGLTMTSSVMGSFFYLIVGLHALHAVLALVALVYAWIRLQEGRLRSDLFAGIQVFWYFVVGIWPFIYLRVYP